MRKTSGQLHGRPKSIYHTRIDPRRVGLGSAGAPQWRPPVIVSITGPRETHDYRDYNLWVLSYNPQKTSQKNLTV